MVEENALDISADDLLDLISNHAFIHQLHRSFINPIESIFTEAWDTFNSCLIFLNLDEAIFSCSDDLALFLVLSRLTLHSFEVDWSQYLLWYRQLALRWMFGSNLWEEWLRGSVLGLWLFRAERFRRLSVLSLELLGLIGWIQGTQLVAILRVIWSSLVHLLTLLALSAHKGKRWVALLLLLVGRSCDQWLCWLQQLKNTWLHAPLAFFLFGHLGVV